MIETDASQKSVKDRIIAITTDEGCTQSQIARESGMSASALSGYLSGTYPGDIKAVEKKLSQWMALRERKTEKTSNVPLAIDYIKTPTGDYIDSGCEYGQLFNDLVLCVGGAGVGKTKALENRKKMNPNVFMATMSPVNAGVSPCLSELGYALGMNDLCGQPTRVFHEIVRKCKGTNSLIIIDEAQHLHATSLEVLRALHDAAKIGMVLAGNEMVYARITDRGQRTATFAQLFSRVGKRLRILKPLKADAVAIAEAYGLTGQKEIDAAWAIAQKPGALRMLVKTLRLAFVLAQGADKPVDIHFIKAAWLDLSGETYRTGQ